MDLRVYNTVQLRAYLSGVIGAAIYALEPDAIFARRSRHAYGIESSTAFKKGLRQDLRYTEPSSNKVLCKKIFSSLVQLDELVEHDQVTVIMHTWPSVCMAIVERILLQIQALKIFLRSFHGH